MSHRGLHHRRYGPNAGDCANRANKGYSLSWLQVNADGFGDNNWQITTMEVFGQHLYAGTYWLDFDTGAEKGQIWRTDDDENWVKVFEEDVNAASELVVFKEELYAGSFSGLIWRSKDGLTWNEVVSERFGGSNNGIARFAVYQNDLYVSTWNLKQEHKSGAPPMG